MSYRITVAKVKFHSHTAFLRMCKDQRWQPQPLSVGSRLWSFSVQVAGARWPLSVACNISTGAVTIDGDYQRYLQPVIDGLPAAYLRAAVYMRAEEEGFNVVETPTAEGTFLTIEVPDGYQTERVMEGVAL